MPQPCCMRTMILHPLSTVNDLALHRWKLHGNKWQGQHSPSREYALECPAIIICELPFATKAWLTLSLQEVSECSTYPFVHVICSILCRNCHVAMYLLLPEAVESTAFAVAQHSCVSESTFLQWPTKRNFCSLYLHLARLA